MKQTISLLFLLFSCSTLVFQSCQSRTTKGAMKRGEVLKSNLDSFEKNRVKLSASLVSSLEGAKEDLTAENPNLPEVSEDFEKQWRSIMSRYNKLKNNYEAVGQSSRAYFDELNGLSSNINNVELRKSELQKNKDLEVRWQKTFDTAGASIQKITQVLESGNDFHMVLVASSVRQNIEQNVDELNNMAEQAKVLLSDLEIFTQAGKDLVNGEG